jgi:2-hydroxy-3-keto-5-methylthiopentenyl-1-phosphate phosphatase
MKTIVQCDFDGTITEADASYLILEDFAEGNWTEILQEYKTHKITVAEFNKRAFAMVRADKSTLLKMITEKVHFRPGFHSFVKYCRENELRLIIVSNGFDFYIEHLLKINEVQEIEWYAAKTDFRDGIMQIQYLGPNSQILDEGFKEAYLELFLNENYRVIYAGNGDSDIVPSKKAHLVFAREELRDYYQSKNLSFIPFENFEDIIEQLK